MKKRMVVVVTRHVGRPLFKQYKNVLKRRRSLWHDSPADLMVFIHGGKPSPRELRLLKRSGYPIIDGNGKTNGTLPGGALQLIIKQLVDKYEFVGWMDDDGDLKNPPRSIARIIKEFDKHPDVGQCGPAYGIYAHWKLNGKPAGELRASPWTTLGCQLFRSKHLKKLDLRPLKRFIFCGDMALSMMMVCAGFKNWMVMDKTFDHKNSWGDIKPAKNMDEFWKREPKYIKDYDTALEVFGHNKRCLRSIKIIRKNQRTHKGWQRMAEDFMKKRGIKSEKARAVVVHRKSSRA